jgi:3-dehydroquinate synthase
MICEKTSYVFDTPQRKTDVYWGKHLFEDLSDLLSKDFPDTKIAVICDANTQRIYGEKLNKILISKNLNSYLIAFPAGEKNKNRKNKVKIEDALIALNFMRNDLIIALGGGVVGDLAGYVAATYMRGIRYIYYPTSLLAQVDSCIGGKTGINTHSAKNILGAFHHPIKIFIDSAVLHSLPEKHLRNGLAEVIKHAIICDPDFFYYLKNTMLSGWNRLSSEDTSRILMKNYQIKSKIVEEDTEEENKRKILNLGHSIGHAIEKLSAWRLLHGESIAIGMACEAFYAMLHYKLEEKELLQIMELLTQTGFDIRIPETLKIEEIVEQLKHDKKNRNNTIEFVVLDKIGQIRYRDQTYTESVNPGVLEKCLRKYNSYVENHFGI